MLKKNLKLSYSVVPILLVALCPLAIYAQETRAQEKQEQKAEQISAKQTATVTGCLRKGDEPGEFSITGKDGKTWGLRSKSVSLAEHVGHKVTVIGSAARESKAEKTEERKEGKMEKAAGKEEYGDLNVSSLKMVSPTCK